MLTCIQWPVVVFLEAFGNKTYKLELQIQKLHYESGRQIIWKVSSQSPAQSGETFFMLVM
jgi:hypothetical protein